MRRTEFQNKVEFIPTGSLDLLVVVEYPNSLLSRLARRFRPDKPVRLPLFDQRGTAIASEIAMVPYDARIRGFWINSGSIVEEEDLLL